MGGISILGTRGIVVPFSTAAYRASIVQALQVAKANGCRHVVITTGGGARNMPCKSIRICRKKHLLKWVILSGLR